MASNDPFTKALLKSSQAQPKPKAKPDDAFSAAVKAKTTQTPTFTQLRDKSLSEKKATQGNLVNAMARVDELLGLSGPDRFTNPVRMAIKSALQTGPNPVVTPKRLNDVLGYVARGDMPGLLKLGDKNRAKFKAYSDAYGQQPESTGLQGALDRLQDEFSNSGSDIAKQYAEGGKANGAIGKFGGGLSGIADAVGKFGPTNIAKMIAEGSAGGHSFRAEDTPTSQVAHGAAELGEFAIPIYGAVKGGAWVAGLGGKMLKEGSAAPIMREAVQPAITQASNALDMADQVRGGTLRKSGAFNWALPKDQVTPAEGILGALNTGFGVYGAAHGAGELSAKAKSMRGKPAPIAAERPVAPQFDSTVLETPKPVQTPAAEAPSVSAGHLDALDTVIGQLEGNKPAPRTRQRKQKPVEAPVQIEQPAPILESQATPVTSQVKEPPPPAETLATKYGKEDAGSIPAASTKHEDQWEIGDTLISTSPDGHLKTPVEYRGRVGVSDMHVVFDPKSGMQFQVKGSQLVDNEMRPLVTVKAKPQLDDAPLPATFNRGFVPFHTLPLHELTLAEVSRGGHPSVDAIPHGPVTSRLKSDVAAKWGKSVTATSKFGPKSAEATASANSYESALRLYELKRGAEIDASHYAAVEQALAEGKPVPPEVLADYPDLALKAKGVDGEWFQKYVKPGDLHKAYDRSAKIGLARELGLPDNAFAKVSYEDWGKLFQEYKARTGNSSFPRSEDINLNINAPGEKKYGAGDLAPTNPAPKQAPHTAAHDEVIKQLGGEDTVPAAEPAGTKAAQPQTTTEQLDTASSQRITMDEVRAARKKPSKEWTEAENKAIESGAFIIDTSDVISRAWKPTKDSIIMQGEPVNGEPWWTNRHFLFKGDAPFEITSGQTPPVSRILPDASKQAFLHLRHAVSFIRNKKEANKFVFTDGSGREFHVDAQYVKFAHKYFGENIQFKGDDPYRPVSVIKDGEQVGVIMPMNPDAIDGTLDLRSQPTAGRPAQAADQKSQAGKHGNTEQPERPSAIKEKLAGVDQKIADIEKDLKKNPGTGGKGKQSGAAYVPIREAQLLALKGLRFALETGSKVEDAIRAVAEKLGYGEDHIKRAKAIAEQYGKDWHPEYTGRPLTESDVIPQFDAKAITGRRAAKPVEAPPKIETKEPPESVGVANRYTGQENINTVKGKGALMDEAAASYTPQAARAIVDGVKAGKDLSPEDVAMLHTHIAALTKDMSAIEKQPGLPMDKPEYRALYDQKAAAQDAIDTSAKKAFAGIGHALQGAVDVNDFSYSGVHRAIAAVNKKLAQSREFQIKIKELTDRNAELAKELEAAKERAKARGSAGQARNAKPVPEARRLFKQAKYDEIVARRQDAANRAASGGDMRARSGPVDAQDLADIAYIVGYHIENGVRSLAALAKNVREHVPGATDEQVSAATQRALDAISQARKGKARNRPDLSDLRKESYNANYPNNATDPEVARALTKKIINESEIKAHVIAAANRAHFEQLPWYGKAAKIIGNASTTVTALRATLDNSIPGRQGFFLLTRNPKLWAEGWMRSWMSLTEKGLENQHVKAAQSPRFDEAIQDKTLHLSGFRHLPEQEWLISEKVAQLPGVKHSERMAEGFATIRMSRYEQLANHLESVLGESLGKDTRKILAQFVNSETGRGYVPPNMQFLSKIMFSARFASSRIETLLFVDTLRAAKAVKFAEREAANAKAEGNTALANKWAAQARQGKAAGKVFATETAKTHAVLSGLLALAYAVSQTEEGKKAGVRVDLDPRGTSFGSVWVGDQFYYDMTGGLGPWARMSSRTAATAAGVVTQKDIPIRSKFDVRTQAIDQWKKTGNFPTTPKPGQTLGENALSFAIGKLAPVPGAVANSLLEPKYKRRQFSITDYFVPMSAQNAYQGVSKNQSIGRVAINTIIEFLGGSVSGPGAWDKPQRH